MKKPWTTPTVTEKGQIMPLADPDVCHDDPDYLAMRNRVVELEACIRDLEEHQFTYMCGYCRAEIQLTKFGDVTCPSCGGEMKLTLWIDPIALLKPDYSWGSHP